MYKSKQILKNLILTLTIVVVFFGNCAIVEASTIIEPADNQYFELKATTITDVDGQNKQVIMELWGYEIDFKRI